MVKEAFPLPLPSPNLAPGVPKARLNAVVTPWKHTTLEPSSALTLGEDVQSKEIMDPHSLRSRRQILAALGQAGGWSRVRGAPKPPRGVRTSMPGLEGEGEESEHGTLCTYT